MAILEVKDLHKNFGKTEVLKGIDFSIEQGQVLAILGSSRQRKDHAAAQPEFFGNAGARPDSVAG